MSIGEKIIDLRKKNKLTQEKLAEKLGVSRQTLSNWESNITSPDIKQAKELSKIFNISLDELVDNEIKDILINKINNTEKVVGKTTKNVKKIIIILYVIIMIALISRTIHFLTKKDFTNKYQMEFTCTLDDKEYNIYLDVIDDINYVITKYENGSFEKYNAGDSLSDIFNSFEIIKKVLLIKGATCR